MKRQFLLYRFFLLLAFGTSVPLLGQPVIRATKDDGVPATNRLDRSNVVTYVNIITNAGSITATNVVLVDPAPANTTEVEGSLRVTPVAVDDAYMAVGNTQLTNSAPGVLANDFDPDNSGTLIVLPESVSRVSGTATNGILNIYYDGSFLYTPGVGQTGTERFQYTIRDGHGESSFTPGYVDFTVSNRVWYVQAGSFNGTGRNHEPFNNLGSASTSANASSDIIYVLGGTVGGNAALDAGQKLLGRGVDLVVNGMTLYSAGTRPVLTNASGTIVTAGAGNVIAGLDLSNRTGSAISGTSIGTLTISNVTIAGIGQALDLANGTVNAVFDSISASNAVTGISLTGIDGSLVISNGSLTRLTGTDFYVTGGNATIVYGGEIIDSYSTPGRCIEILNRTGGTVTFNGTITNTGSGINLTGNSGEIHFTGTIGLNTGSSAAFNATGGGTITASNSNNTIVTTTGIALNVSGTTIGAGGLRFRSISANGASSGIVLNNTGSGVLTVTGGNNRTQGGDNSGGTIQNSTSHGISLTSVANPSFANMRILNTARSGIVGTGVSGFTFVNGTIQNCGTSENADDSNIRFDDAAAGAVNVSGFVTITNCVLNNSRYHGITIQQAAGTLTNVAIVGNQFTSAANVTDSLGSAVRLIAIGNSYTAASVTRATLANNEINNFPNGAGFIIQGGNPSGSGSSTIMGVAGDNNSVIALTGNLMNGGSLGSGSQPDRFVTASVNGSGQGNFNISGNGSGASPIARIDGVVIEVSAFGSANVTATVTNNVIAAYNAIGLAGIAIGCDNWWSTNDSPTLTSVISGNNVSQTDGPGIYALARNSAGSHVTRIINNTVAAPVNTTQARAGIRVDSGSSAGNTTVCLEITGNTTSGSTNSGTGTTSPGINLRKQGTVSTINAFRIEGMSATASPGIENYVNSQNTSASGTFGVGGTALLSATSGFGSCTAP